MQNAREGAAPAGLPDRLGEVRSRGCVRWRSVAHRSPSGLSRGTRRSTLAEKALHRAYLRQAYADAKTGFVTGITERALAEGLPRDIRPA